MFARPGLCGMGIGRLGLMSASQVTLLQQAIAAIRRNNGALFYVPANFAGAWTNSAGTDPVDAVADVLGLMTDRSYGGAVGDELVTNGAWTISGTGVTVSGNTVTFSSSLLADSCQNTGLVVSGKAYTARLTVSGYSGGGVSFMVAGNSIGSLYSANGTYSQVIVPGASGAIGVRSSGLTTNAVVSSISVREIIGNHATQATTANKPTVQTNAQGRYVMLFDGSNDSLSTNITTGNEGWVCAGITPTLSDATSRTIFCSGATGNTQSGIFLRYLAGAVQLAVGNGTIRTTTSIPLLAGSTAVTSASWNNSTYSIDVNTALASATALSGSVAGALPLSLGGFVGSFTFSGAVSAFVHCPVLPSAADRAIIRKWIGSLQGQTL